MTLKYVSEVRVLTQPDGSWRVAVIFEDGTTNAYPYDFESYHEASKFADGMCSAFFMCCLYVGKESEVCAGTQNERETSGVKDS